MQLHVSVILSKTKGKWNVAGIAQGIKGKHASMNKSFLDSWNKRPWETLQEESSGGHLR